MITAGFLYVRAITYRIAVTPWLKHSIEWVVPGY